MSDRSERVRRTQVLLNPWHRQFATGQVGGSLYAVPRGQRAEAATLLHRSGCRVHVDVIVGPEGHRGVTFSEVALIRAALPTARIDLHLIVLDATSVDDEVTAIDIARTLAFETLTLTGEQIRRHAVRVHRLRSAGIAVWEEIAPGVDEPTAADHVDGALIMLITPGSKETADLGQLDKITALAGRIPVGVDGGVTGAIAHQCHDRGAGYLISGRDLLQTTRTATLPTPASSTPESSPPERRPA